MSNFMNTVPCSDCGRPVEAPSEPDSHGLCESCWEKRLSEASPNEVLYCLDCNKRCEFLPGDDEGETDTFPFTICDDCAETRALNAGYVWDEKANRFVKK